MESRPRDATVRAASGRRSTRTKRGGEPLAAAGEVAEAHPDPHRVRAALGETRAEAARTVASRLVRLAPAIGGGSGGGVHSRCRRAPKEGVPSGASKQVARRSPAKA